MGPRFIATLSLRVNGATAISMVYIHHQYPSSRLSDLATCLSLHFRTSNTPVSCLARSSASLSLDLELDTNLTCVSGMRQDYPSKIFEYVVVQEVWPFSHSSRMIRRNLLFRDRWMHL